MPLKISFSSIDRLINIFLCCFVIPKHLIFVKCILTSIFDHHINLIFIRPVIHDPFSYIIRKIRHQQCDRFVPSIIRTHITVCTTCMNIIFQSFNIIRYLIQQQSVQNTCVHLDHPVHGFCFFFEKLL